MLDMMENQNLLFKAPVTDPANELNLAWMHVIAPIQADSQVTLPSRRREGSFNMSTAAPPLSGYMKSLNMMRLFMLGSIKRPCLKGILVSFQYVSVGLQIAVSMFEHCPAHVPCCILYLAINMVCNIK